MSDSRRQRIQDTVPEAGSVSVEELIARYQVTPQTIPKGVKIEAVSSSEKIESAEIDYICKNACEYFKTPTFFNFKRL